MEALTRNDVAGIHSILVLDETEAVHQLDLSDLSGTMGIEVGFDICLGRCIRKNASVYGRASYQLRASQLCDPRKLYYNCFGIEYSHRDIPLRGRLPKYRRVAETSVDMVAVCSMVVLRAWGTMSRLAGGWPD
jgi:hypothetical protein